MKAKIFGISIAEDSLGELKREQKTRIYLDLSEPKLAEQALKTPIPGKSTGEYIFMAVIDYLETDVDKITYRLADRVAPKESEDRYFMNEINSLWVYGQVALANENYRDAIQSFRRLLNMPNIESVRFFYIEGLYHLTRAYKAHGEDDKAAHYSERLDQAVARDALNIPWSRERESFKALYSL